MYIRPRYIRYRERGYGRLESFFASLAFKKTTTDGQHFSAMSGISGISGFETRSSFVSSSAFPNRRRDSYATIESAEINAVNQEDGPSSFLAPRPTRDSHSDSENSPFHNTNLQGQRRTMKRNSDKRGIDVEMDFDLEHVSKSPHPSWNNHVEERKSPEKNDRELLDRNFEMPLKQDGGFHDPLSGSQNSRETHFSDEHCGQRFS